MIILSILMSVTAITMYILCIGSDKRDKAWKAMASKDNLSYKPFEDMK